MAVDELLNKRFRSAAGARNKLVEKRMMGGICFMLNGNMLGGADRNPDTQEGRFLFRVGKDNEQKALESQGASVVEQGGRRMGGMVFVESDSLSDAQMKSLMKLALSFVGNLASK